MTKKRQTATKAKIKEAFTYLLKNKGFDMLTVTDITREANINRGTFYIHYLDKYDLLEKLEDEVIGDLEDILLQEKNIEIDEEAVELIPYDAIVKALYHVKDDFDFVEALVKNGGDSYFVKKIKDVLEELVESRIKKIPNLEFSKRNLPADYALEILLAAITAIIILWVKKGAVETPEEIAFMIVQAKEISPYELLI